MFAAEARADTTQTFRLLQIFTTSGDILRVSESQKTTVGDFAGRFSSKESTFSISPMSGCVMPAFRSSAKSFRTTSSGTSHPDLLVTPVIEDTLYRPWPRRTETFLATSSLARCQIAAPTQKFEPAIRGRLWGVVAPCWGVVAPCGHLNGKSGDSRTALCERGFLSGRSGYRRQAAGAARSLERPNRPRC